MRIYINGQSETLAEGASVADVAHAQGWDASRVAIEINRRIVPRSLYAQTEVGEGDRIEIVRFIGGG